MATMFDCSNDFSFDFFKADCEKYSALPIRGVHCKKDASNNEIFIRNLKLICNEFIAENTERFTERGINSSGKNYSYVRYTDMGKALWNFLLSDIYIRDWYKDVYEQRPYLHGDIYLWALGYRQLVDRLLWCGLSLQTMDDIVDGYATRASDSRARMEAFAREHYNFDTTEETA